MKDFVAAAVVARAIFDPSSSGSDCFELPADTEESDGPDDPELGRADYWTCVKCKNKQNNPMYRYCEKCYQVPFIYLFIFNEFFRLSFFLKV